MDLDILIKASKAGDVIQLQAGTYWTRGNPISGPGGNALKAGTKLIGAGVDKTIIKFLAPDFIATDYMIVFGSGDNFVISDLTVDCMVNSPLESFSNFKRQGISLVGSNCTIRNCRVIRPFGNYTQDRECFPLKIFGGVNNLIENCEVSQIKGTYVSAIGVNGGEIRNCRVIYPDKTFGDKTYFWVGYNLERAKNCLVHHNVALNAVDGYYTDTDTTDGLQIYNNQFLNVQRGIHINMQNLANRVEAPQGVQNVVIRDNFITLKTNAPYVAAFELDNTVTPYNPVGVTTQNWINNIQILNNIVGYRYKDCPDMNWNCRLLFNIATQAPNPTPTLGISNITISGNKTCDTMKREPWRYRNKSNNAKNINCSENPTWIVT